MEHIPDWINGWRRLTWDHDEVVLGYHDVRFPPYVMNNIYRQLECLIGHRLVYFIPSITDSDKFRELGGDIWTPLNELKKHTPEENRKVWEDSYKIGMLKSVEKNGGIFAQVSIDEKFQVFPFQSYVLCLGIDSNSVQFEPFNELVYSEKFVIKSCTVKGLYFKSVDNPNEVDFDTRMNNYYKCRMLEMFIYLPGRAYY